MTESYPLPNDRKRLKKHIFLLGVSGAGKSRMGKALAEDIKLPFIDHDHECKERFGKIGEFQEREGIKITDQALIDLVTDMLEKENQAVISISPRVTPSKVVWEKLASSGYSFFLHTLPMHIHKRANITVGDPSIDHPFVPATDEERFLQECKYDFYYYYFWRTSSANNADYFIPCEGEFYKDYDYLHRKVESVLAKKQ